MSRKKTRKISHLVHAPLPDSRAERHLFPGVVPVQVRGYQSFGRTVEEHNLSRPHIKSHGWRCNAVQVVGGQGVCRHVVHLSAGEVG